MVPKMTSSRCSGSNPVRARNRGREGGVRIEGGGIARRSRRLCEIRNDQGREVLSAIADDDRQRNPFRLLEGVFDRLGRGLFASGEDDELLLPIGDPQK